MRFGATDTRTGAFVRFGGVNYSVPKAEVQRLYSGASRPKTAEQAFALLGVDPRKWLKNPTYEGTADVKGVQADHVSAGVDVERLADVVSKLASKVPSGASTQLSGTDEDRLVSAMKDPKLDLYVGRADHVVRKFSFQARIEASNGTGQVSVDMVLSDVNKPQRVTTPTAARPFTQLEGDLRTGGLAALTGGGTATGTAPAPPAAPAGASSPDASAVPPDAQDYLACVRKAGSAAALEGCSSLLR